MRALIGQGTPRELADAVRRAFLVVVQTDIAMAFVIIARIDGTSVMFAVAAAPETG